MVCVITAVIVLAVSANIALTFGMIGALSIVRYRTAIKDPVDVAFIFWSITSGIVAGTGEVWFLLAASAGIGLVVIVLFRVRTSSNTFLLIIDTQAEGAEALRTAVHALKIKTVLKSKSLIADRAELVFELKLPQNADLAFLDELNKREDVRSAVLVGYNGDYAE
jgi:hypothetical protein